MGKQSRTTVNGNMLIPPIEPARSYQQYSTECRTGSYLPHDQCSSSIITINELARYSNIDCYPERGRISQAALASFKNAPHDIELIIHDSNEETCTIKLRSSHFNKFPRIFNGMLRPVDPTRITQITWTIKDFPFLTIESIRFMIAMGLGQKPHLWFSSVHVDQSVPDMPAVMRESIQRMLLAIQYLEAVRTIGLAMPYVRLGLYVVGKELDWFNLELLLSYVTLSPRVSHVWDAKPNDHLHTIFEPLVAGLREVLNTYDKPEIFSSILIHIITFLQSKMPPLEDLSPPTVVSRDLGATELPLDDGYLPSITENIARYKHRLMTVRLGSVLGARKDVNEANLVKDYIIPAILVSLPFGLLKMFLFHLDLTPRQRFDLTLTVCNWRRRRQFRRIKQVAARLGGFVCWSRPNWTHQESKRPSVEDWPERMQWVEVPFLVNIKDKQTGGVRDFCDFKRFYYTWQILSPGEIEMLDGKQSRVGELEPIARFLRGNDSQRNKDKRQWQLPPNSLPATPPGTQQMANAAGDRRRLPAPIAAASTPRRNSNRGGQIAYHAMPADIQASPTDVQSGQATVNGSSGLPAQEVPLSTSSAMHLPAQNQQRAEAMSVPFEPLQPTVSQTLETLNTQSPAEAQVSARSSEPQRAEVSPPNTSTQQFEDQTQQRQATTRSQHPQVQQEIAHQSTPMRRRQTEPTPRSIPSQVYQQSGSSCPQTPCRQVNSQQREIAGRQQPLPRLPQASASLIRNNFAESQPLPLSQPAQIQQVQPQQTLSPSSHMAYLVSQAQDIQAQQGVAAQAAGQRASELQSPQLPSTGNVQSPTLQTPSPAFNAVHTPPRSAYRSLAGGQQWQLWSQPSPIPPSAVIGFQPQQRSSVIDQQSNVRPSPSPPSLVGRNSVPLQQPSPAMIRHAHVRYTRSNASPAEEAICQPTHLSMAEQLQMQHTCAGQELMFQAMGAQTPHPVNAMSPQVPAQRPQLPAIPMTQRPIPTQQRTQTDHEQLQAQYVHAQQQQQRQLQATQPELTRMPHPHYHHHHHYHQHTQLPGVLRAHSQMPPKRALSEDLESPPHRSGVSPQEWSAAYQQMQGQQGIAQPIEYTGMQNLQGYGTGYQQPLQQVSGYRLPSQQLFAYSHQNQNNVASQSNAVPRIFSAQCPGQRSSQGRPGETLVPGMFGLPTPDISP